MAEHISPQKSEGELTKKLTDYLKTQGVFTLVLSGGSSFQTRGLPDRVMCHHSWLHGIFVEFKLPYNKQSKIQMWVSEEMNKRNPGTSFVVKFWPADVLSIDGVSFSQEDFVQHIKELL